MLFFKKTEHYLPFLLPFLLIFSRTFADVTVIIVSVLFILKCSYEKKFFLNEPWVKSTIFFILYLVFINSSLSINPKDSLIYSISFIRWPIFSLALCYWIFSEKNSLDKFFNSLLIVSLIFLLDIWYQFLIDGSGIFGLSQNNYINRLSVPFTNNVIPGRFIAIYSSVLCLILLSKNLLNNNFNLNSIFIIFFISSISIFITGERASFIIYITSILFSLFAIILFEKKMFIPVIFFLFLLLLVLISTFFINFETFNRIIISSFEKITSFLSSDYGEVFITSYEKWKNNFIFGGGLHQYSYIEPIYSEGKIWNETKIPHAHNITFNLLVEIGLTGFLLFYLIIANIIKLIFLKLSQQKKGLLIVFNLMILYINFFPFHTHFKLSHNWINASSWLCIGIILATLRYHEKNTYRQKN